MPDIIHRIGIKATPEAVFQALSTLEGLAGWWTEDTVGDPSPRGSVTFSFQTPTGDLLGRMVFAVDDLSRIAAVRWTCLEGPPDWVGTSVTFDLSVQDGQTIVIFGHRGWAEASESMAHCSMKWAVFLLSLRALVETGKGRPSPHDLKIDNWN